MITNAELVDEYIECAEDIKLATERMREIRKRLGVGKHLSPSNPGVQLVVQQTGGCWRVSVSKLRGFVSNALLDQCKTWSPGYLTASVRKIKEKAK